MASDPFPRTVPSMQSHSLGDKGKGWWQTSWESRSLHNSSSGIWELPACVGSVAPPFTSSCHPLDSNRVGAIVSEPWVCWGRGKNSLSAPYTKILVLAMAPGLKETVSTWGPQIDMEYNNILGYSWHSLISLLNRNIIQDRWGDHEIRLKNACRSYLKIMNVSRMI